MPERTRPHSTASRRGPFREDFGETIHQLRGALTEALAGCRLDPRRPQELARECGLDKNLAWKTSRLVQADDPYDAAAFVPGSAGLRILVRALRGREAPDELLGRVQEAIADFERMVAVHAGDRGALERIVGATREQGVGDGSLEPLRRMAFQGNSVIFGAQARAAFTLRVVAPSAGDGSRADIATVRGLRDFRRLRPTASWPVLSIRTLSEGVRVGGTWEPIEPLSGGASAPLLRDHSSRPLPELRGIVEADRITYELAEGPVGNTAALDVAVGGIDRAHVPVRGTDNDAVGEHYCRSDTPVEWLQFDLLLHRDLPFSTPPGFCLHGCTPGEEVFPLSRQVRCHLPADGGVHELGSNASGLTSPHIPGYAELAARVCERVGSPLEHFRAYRVVQSYPPIPVTLVLHHRLAPARGEGLVRP
jgi:hypothetical protein